MKGLWNLFLRWKEYNRRRALHSAEVRGVMDGAKAGSAHNGANSTPMFGK